MAQGYTLVRLNMFEPVAWQGTVTTAHELQIRISDGYREAIYEGFFQYAGDIVSGGTLYRYQEFAGGELTLEIDEISAPASTAAAYIQSGDISSLYELVLAGDDDLIGSAADDSLIGYAGDDFLRGGFGSDDLFGLDGNDRLYGGPGENFLNGGTGTDTAQYDSFVANYDLDIRDGSAVVTQRYTGDSDNLVSIERLDFGEAMLAFDIDGNAGQSYRLYQAAFDRTPDTPGLSYWINQMDAGVALSDLANAFLRSGEFQNLYGANPSDEAYVDLLYRNVLGRGADQGGYDYWLDQKRAGLSDAEILVEFSESAENQANVIGLIQNGIWLDPLATMYG